MIDLSSFAQTLGGRKVAVFGIGISNLAAIKAMRAAGIAVDAWDDKDENRSAAQDAGASLNDFVQNGMAGYACLVLAPGVPLHFPEPHPVVAAARDAQVEIICDIEILARSKPPRPIIAITGTNGKSTTTALIGHILNEAGYGAAIGGNIGTAALALDVPAAGGAFVLEISSFQMDLCPSFAPQIAVHLNFSPDHIDRHGDMDGYINAKRALFRGAGQGVIGVDDDWSRAMYDALRADGARTLHPVSVGAGKDHVVEDGVYVAASRLYNTIDGNDPADGFDVAIATLPGAHNHQNAAAAFAACRLLGVPEDAIMDAMRRFPGLPHRQFMVRVMNGVPYVNDSKATNADATMRALACYNRIFLIAGGLAKEGGLNGIEPYLGRIAHAYLIGAAAEEFDTWLRRHNVQTTICHTLELAVQSAHLAAQDTRGEPGGAGVVLLSPACASFDQFRSFEHRGAVFTDLVNALPEDAS